MPLRCAESDPYQTLQEGLEILAAAESLCSARTEIGGGGLHGAASATLTLGRAAAAGRSHPFHRHHHLRSEPVGVAMPPQFPCCNGATASTPRPPGPSPPASPPGPRPSSLRLPSPHRTLPRPVSPPPPSPPRPAARGPHRTLHHIHRARADLCATYNSRSIRKDRNRRPPC